MSETTAAPEATPAPVSPESTPVAPTPEQAAPPQEGAETTTDDSSQEDASDQDKPKKPRQTFGERIGEVYGRMKSFERENAQLRDQIARLQQPVVDPQQWDQLSYEQQQAAIARTAVRQERSAELQAEQQSRAQAHQEAIGEMFFARMEAAVEQIPDIIQAMSDPTLPVSDVAVRIMAESDRGAQIGYWLSQNRAEALRISRLDPVRQALELGRIEQRVSSASKARKTSQAPPPVPTVASGNPGSAKGPEQMSVDDMSAYLKRTGVLR